MGGHGLDVDAPSSARVGNSRHPLLHGELASQARQVAYDIARALADHDAHHLAGASDAALYWAHASEVFPEAWVERAFDRALQRLGDAITLGVPTLALFGGLTHAAWVAHHVAGTDGSVEEDDENELPPRADAILVDTIERPDWVGPYDLIGGLVGFGVYFLARGERPVARRGLEITMRRLVSMARPVDGGLGWRTPPELLPAHHRRSHPDGLFDLGLAHGIVGVIALEAAVLQSGALPRLEDELRGSLVGAIAFLESHRHDERASSTFDWCVAPGIAGHEARTAWCYGDLGVAVALLRAARALHDDALHERAVSLARACAVRPHDVCRVDDAGLCHGAAGLGHILGRIWQATGDPIVRDGAQRWFEDTLSRRGADGIAGYAAFDARVVDGNRVGWTDDPGILTGAAGIGLALMSAIGGSLDWDGLLLTDIAPIG